MKRFVEKRYICLFIFFSILLILPLIYGDIYLSDDKYFHFLRIENLYISVKNSNFYPSIYSYMLYGYGYGIPLFYPQMFLYIPVLFRLIGFSLDNSYNLFLILINLSTLLVAYKCFLTFFKNKKYAYVVAILYLFMPYRLHVLYGRNALGELLAMVFLPMLFLFIYKFLVDDIVDKVLLITVFSLVLNTHIISVYIFALILFVVFIINIKKVFKLKHIKDLIQCVCIVILLNSYFLIPLLEQLLSQRFWFNKHLMGGLQDNAFVILGDEPIYLKFIILAFICMAIYLIFDKFLKSWSVYLKWLISVSVFMLIINTDIFFWEIINIPLLDNIQFPFRFYLILNITIPLIIIEIYRYIENKEYSFNLKQIYINFIKFCLCFIFCYFLFSVFLGERVPNNYIFDNDYLVGGEYLSEGYSPEYVSKNVGQVKGSSKITCDKEEDMYFIKMNGSVFNSEIELPIIYYKGYSVSNEFKDLINISRSENGLIKLTPIKPISFDFELYYSGTLIKKVSTVISLITCICLMVFINIKKSLDK